MWHSNLFARGSSSSRTSTVCRKPRWPLPYPTCAGQGCRALAVMEVILFRFSEVGPTHRGTISVSNFTNLQPTKSIRSSFRTARPLGRRPPLANYFGRRPCTLARAALRSVFRFQSKIQSPKSKTRIRVYRRCRRPPPGPVFGEGFNLLYFAAINKLRSSTQHPAPTIHSSIALCTQYSFLGMYQSCPNSTHCKFPRVSLFSSPSCSDEPFPL